MVPFDATLYKERLAQSQDCKTCEKVPMPKFDRDEKTYIFISYSHADYKAVYSDLADLYEKNVRFFYDNRLQPGIAWDKDVCDWIHHPNCKGVIFYLSEHLFRSASIFKEIRFTLGFDLDGNSVDDPLPYFCVNLTDLQPSKLLGKVMGEQDDIDEDQIHTLLDVFSNKRTYLRYSDQMHAADLYE